MEANSIFGKSMVTDPTAGLNHRAMSVQSQSGSGAPHRADLQQAMGWLGMNIHLMDLYSISLNTAVSSATKEQRRLLHKQVHGLILP